MNIIHRLQTMKQLRDRDDPICMHSLLEVNVPSGTF